MRKLFLMLIVLPILCFGTTDLIIHEVGRDYDFIIFGDTNDVSITASADVDTLLVNLIEIAHYNYHTSLIYGTDSVDAFYKEGMTVDDLDSLAWIHYDTLTTQTESLRKFDFGGAGRYLRLRYIVYTKSAAKFHWRIGLWRH